MKPLPFSSTYAHPDDPLPLHLERVALRAAASLAPLAQPEIRLIAFLAGLFHDIGKGTYYFQDYLFKTKRKTKLTPHAKSGAILSWWYTGEAGLPLWQRLAIFIAVLRHHGSLNYDSWHQSLEQVRCDFEDSKDPLHQQLASLDLEGIHAWLQNVTEREGLVFGLHASLGTLSAETLREHLLERRSAGRTRLRQAFQQLEQALTFLAGFGGLLAMDKIDAATQGVMIARQSIPREAVAIFMQHHLKLNSATVSPLDDRRTRIGREVEHTWLKHIEEPLLTLTAPTGSGKTLTILNAALALRSEVQRNQGYSPKIIYCLPFTAVIDQNHTIFQKVMRASGLDDREDVLLKHHHLVEGLFRTADAEYQPDGAGQLLTETWQSEIIVTTFYQLLHTLLSNDNSNLKRAGQLTGSIILMDEVQAVPLHYWEALRHLFQSAAHSLGCRFVLLTATKPLIFRPQDACELLPSHPEHFKALSRVRLICHQQKSASLSEFLTRLAVATNYSSSILIILNRVKAVQTVFTGLRELFPDKRLIALSTGLTPRDRRVRIRLIQRLLRKQIPCMVVATQLVEAGVDISFPVVHRDMAPLDSIIQSAGRCNRHAVASQVGEVHLWSFHAEKSDSSPGELLWQRVYDSPLIEVTREILKEQDLWNESDFLTLSQRYFEDCWHRHDQTRVDKWLIQGNFEKLGKDFQLISEGPPKASFFIVNRASDQALWDRYQAIHTDETLSPLEKDKQFRKIRYAFFERVIQVYAPANLNNEIVRLEAGEETYTRSTGFVQTYKEKSTCIL